MFYLLRSVLIFSLLCSWLCLHAQEAKTMDAGLAKSFLNRKANIKLSISDIFNSDRLKYATLFQNLNLNSTEKAETRIVRLDFTYRFGKGMESKSFSRRTGNEEESKRIRN